MENKINLVEILKDCPSGMELDCTIYDKVTLAEVYNREDISFPIRVLRKDGISLTLTKYGQCTDADFAKCVIFPKGKTTWEGFVPPCRFEDGDVVFYSNTIAIFKEWGDETLFRTHCVFYPTVSNPVYQFEISRPLFGKGIRREARFATKEERQELFEAIETNGYQWNTETKTLEKLLKFKVGDRIKHKDSGIYCTLGDYSDGISAYRTNIGLSLTYKDLEQWELLPAKFDISTLKPFESRVLIRDKDSQDWIGAFYSHYDVKDDYPYHCINFGRYKQCIPYEGNEHLLGKTNDCDDYYKTWK